jgi:2-keto-4-pentenoate hydratase/2-oxohepta-3-ene-1,7-dioic acid hydratase in catechol pathway
VKLAVFNHPVAGPLRLGAVTGDGQGIVDITAALPWAHDPDPLTAGWWRSLCRDHAQVLGVLADAEARGPVLALDSVTLRAPTVGPTKILASASNYAEHVAEMHAVQERTLGRVETWMMNFDVFLKSPSAIVGPADDIVIPPAIRAAGHEVHHESELVIIVGRGGKDIPRRDALDHVFGYTIGLDITVRAEGDRSRRKSYDSFSPLGPWITTAEEAGDPAAFDIELTCNGQPRQHVNTSSMITPVPDIVAYASQMMTLVPGDVIFTGAPPGVGPIVPGDVLDASISRLGSLHIAVR